VIHSKGKAMKPREIKPSTVYRIVDRNTNESVGSYSRAYCDEYDFNSVYEARLANCHGMFVDEKKYKIARYKVTYELIEDDAAIEKKDADNYKLDLERFEH
jgi:hypothetical protein